MIYQKKTINNVPTKRPISNSVPVGNPVGTIISTYKKIQPRNYLYCDGSTFDETIYPALYLYLGSNVLPDYRECAMVGAEKNTTDVFDSTETNPSTGLPGTQNHDVYTVGQFKDDQVQNHSHNVTAVNNSQNKARTLGSGDSGFGCSSAGGDPFVYEQGQDGRKGTVTRGKRKAVYYYIKAVDGVDISDEDSFLNTVKNYVDGKNSYSTDEVPTGGVWIDGKPIYRKCYSYSANIPVIITTSNLDNIINYYGVCNIGVAKRPYPLVATSGIANINSYTDTEIRLQNDFSTSMQALYMVLEYTKTTD